MLVELAGQRITPGVVDDLAVVDAVVGVLRKMKFQKPLLRHALNRDTRCPHHFTMADHDDALVRTFAMKRVEHAVKASGELREALAVRWLPEEGVHMTATQVVCVPVVALFLGVLIEVAPVPFGEAILSVPAGIRQAKLAGRFHGAGVLGHHVAVETVGVLHELAAEPLSCALGLDPTLVGQAPAGGVPVEELGRHNGVISSFGESLRHIALGFAVPHEHRIDW